MTRAVFDVRIYPGSNGGFDVVARLRGGLQGHGNYSTLEAALEAGRAVAGRVADQPIYVFDFGLAERLAAQVVAGIEALDGGKGAA